MNRWSLMMAVGLCVLGCGGAAEHSEAERGALIVWTGQRVEIELAERIAAGAELEIGLAAHAKEFTKLEPPTVDGQPLAGVRLELGAGSDGLAVFVSRFAPAEPLEVGSVLGTGVRLLSDDAPIRPSRVWLVVDGVEVTSVEW